ncbi:MAG: DUF4136 domain-containing protein [Betaproteobacteria bacterium]
MNLLYLRALKSVVLLALALLAGCSGLRLVDSEVLSYARWQARPAEPGNTYRFERLPSQQGQLGLMEINQDQLEAMAQAALAKLGLVNHPDAPLFIVQLSATTVVQPGYAGGWPGVPVVSIGAGSSGTFVGMAYPMMRPEPPLYVREVQLILRDSRSHEVVYETRARHGGPWSDARALMPAMLDAALSGFPNPPQGPRRVNVQIPR